jgi:serine O-acetyltransferase
MIDERQTVARSPAIAARRALRDEAWKSGVAGLWLDVERSAVDAAAREPFLRQEMVDAVLRHDTPAHIVAAVLARRLMPGSYGQQSLHALILDTLREDPSVLEALGTDLVAVTSRDPACRSPLHALLRLKGFHALQVHRVAHSLFERGKSDVAHALSNQASLAFGVDIHPAARVRTGVLLDHATGIVIGETALVEDEVTIYHGVTLGATGKERGDRHPKVRRAAVLGAGATVLGNVEVGRMSKVGAGSVVLADVPAGCTVAGIPAKIVRTPASCDVRPFEARA